MTSPAETLFTATVHGVKNQLGELLWRLEARGDCQLEQSITLRCAQRLSSALLLWRSGVSGLSLNIDATDAEALLQDLASEYRSLFPDLQIECGSSPNYALDGSCVGFMDRALVSLVLSDIVHNACRAADTRVSLSVSPWATGVCFEIKDDGAGYPTDVLQLAGRDFCQRGQASTGLGLHLADSVARAHRRDTNVGEIHLSNEGGACFRMMLP